MLKVDYVEWQSGDLAASKQFFVEAFGWTFTDYGPEYAAFRAGLDGGIETAPAGKPRAPLIIVKADDLEGARETVTAAGGTVTQDIFAFPGGHRFHFREPGGVELAVWSES